MLLEISIKEFAIIKELKINFNNGLNILTGETGAGKSIIIDAIELIIGGRSSIEYIRKNAEKAEVEALFDIPSGHPVYEVLNELGITILEDEMLIIKREIFMNGKSICRINGQLVTLTALKDVGQWIVQLYSQLQHQQLLHTDKQLKLLDSYGDFAHLEKINDYKRRFDKYSSLRKEILTLTENEEKTARKIDLLQYQISEISQSNLYIGEEEELSQQKNIIKHSEKISYGINNAYLNLSKENGILELLTQTINYLEQIMVFDNSITKYYDDISSIFYQLEDISTGLNQKSNSVEFDPEQLNVIEDRLSVIHHLKRKYGETIEEILNYSTKITNELEFIKNSDEYLNNLQNELIDITDLIIKDVLEISNKRNILATKLSEQIEKELTDLQMVNTKISIEVSYQEAKEGIDYAGKTYSISQTGLDRINFLISPNPGEPLKPLNKIASGGEVSRIMLAILTILAHKDQVDTIIFDEIDTGVSGRAAQAIAEKLARVSRGKQVFVITHLSQVASMADCYYLIEKRTDNNDTTTVINQLNDEEKIAALSRMLGGNEVTNITYEHAKEMIERGSSFKNKI
ncbi:MAG: DNA repair protein RecN [Vulcanibacillus sp.]